MGIRENIILGTDTVLYSKYEKCIWRMPAMCTRDTISCCR